MTATKTGGATETKVKPGDDPKKVGSDLTEAEDLSIEGLIKTEEEAKDALFEAAMELHDLRDDLLERLKDTPDDDAAHQPIQAAVYSIEDSIRSLDGAIRKSAARASTLAEANALGYESSTGEVNSRGRAVSRAATKAAAEAKGESVVPGAGGGLTWPEAKTPEEIEGEGLKDTV